MAQKKKRFRYFVDKPFQTRFILNFVVLVLISAVISLGFILYVDSQKFSKGVLFEELVKDFYVTTYLSSESMKLKKDLSSLDIQNKFEIISDIDSYVRFLSKQEDNIKEALVLRKKLISRISLGDEKSLFYVIDRAVKEGSVNGNVDIVRWRIDIERGIQECEFEVAENAIGNMLSVLKRKEDIEAVESFAKDFQIYKSLVKDVYDFVVKEPKFVSDVDKVISSLFSQGFVDESVVKSLSNSISRIRNIISGIKGYSSVLYYETKTYGKKAYNLLDLYWRPILALSLLQIILIIVFGLFFSHRIAGPVHRIKKELREIAEGKLPVNHEIRLRKNDFLLDIAREINNTLKSIAERYNIK